MMIGKGGRTRNAPSENKGEKTSSFSSLSRTGKTAESRSRSPTREKPLKGMAKVGPRKVSSQNISSKSKENYSSSLHQKENPNFNKASDSSPQAHTTKLAEKFASPLADRFSDMRDDIASPAFANIVNGYHQRSKMLDDETYSPKYPRSVNRSRSSSYASDPGSVPLDEMDKTGDLPGSESPKSPEERDNKEQPYTSPISPIEDEGGSYFYSKLSDRI